MKRLITLVALVACLTGSALAEIDTPTQADGLAQEFKGHGPADGANQPLVDTPTQADGLAREFGGHGPADGNWIINLLWSVLG